ncbi:HigA family addiction module antitoxin [Nocardia bovistercoris]|uniref:HigA family addiction module antidote protein n=1 Tax=Nocardia bovistercoris TaxID=2785916 RepID=A0A931IDZ2_9NOCA|nr:HigA family addiction module antitoxin [Nocardia bovistercoris]MBH0778352.1 HigA family addiction module antidote protein [Nocardia bovistercoris]
MAITGPLPPTSPGEVLAEEFLEPMRISQNALARALGVPPRQINQIVHGNRAITPRTALLLGRYFGTTAEFWINLQTHYDLVRERENLHDELARIVPRPPVAC